MKIWLFLSLVDEKVDPVIVFAWDAGLSCNAFDIAVRKSHAFFKF